MADHLRTIQEILDQDVSPDKKYVQLIRQIDLNPMTFPDIVAVLILKVASLEAEVQHLRGSAYRV